jgi:hypothetical protein
MPSSSDQASTGAEAHWLLKASEFLDIDDTARALTLAQDLPDILVRLGLNAGMHVIAIEGEGPGYDVVSAWLDGGQQVPFGEPRTFLFGSIEAPLRIRIAIVREGHNVDAPVTESVGQVSDSKIKDPDAVQGEKQSAVVQEVAPANPPTLEDLVRLPISHGEEKPLPAATELGCSGETSAKKAAAAAAQNESSASESRVAEFIRENLAEQEWRRRRAAKPVQRSAVDKNYSPYSVPYE